MAKQNFSKNVETSGQRLTRDALKETVIQVEKSIYAAEFKLDYAPIDFYKSNEYLEENLKYQMSLAIDSYYNLIEYFKHKLHEKAPEIVQNGIVRLTKRLDAILEFINYTDKNSKLNSVETDFLRDIAFDLNNSLNSINVVVDYIEFSRTFGYLFEKQPDNEMNIEKHIDARSFDKKVEDLLLKEDVPRHDVDVLVENLKYEIRIAKARHLRPMWKDRSTHGLEDLTAPEFLKHVHGEDIHNNIVQKDYIRSIDKDLMDAVDAYVSQREKRGQSLGRAQGLKFVASRPATNRRGKLSKSGGTDLV